MEIRKLHPMFGAELVGVDVGRPMTDADFRPIRAAFEEYGLLLFRDQDLDDEKQVEFSLHFGPLEKTISANPAGGTLFARQSNLDIRSGAVIPLEDRRMISQKPNYLGHTASTLRRWRNGRLLGLCAMRGLLGFGAYLRSGLGFRCTHRFKSHGLGRPVRITRTGSSQRIVARLALGIRQDALRRPCTLALSVRGVFGRSPGGRLRRARLFRHRGCRDRRLVDLSPGGPELAGLLLLDQNGL